MALQDTRVACVYLKHSLPNVHQSAVLPLTIFFEQRYSLWSLHKKTAYSQWAITIACATTQHNLVSWKQTSSYLLSVDTLT